MLGSCGEDTAPPSYAPYIDEHAQVETLEIRNERLLGENKRLKRKLKEAKKGERSRHRNTDVSPNQTDSDGRDSTNRNANRTGSADVRSTKPKGKEGSSKTAQVIAVEATAFTAFCDTGCTGITATGIDVSSTIYHEGKRVIAVSPSQIPLGSTVEVSVGGQTFLATAQDTGGAIGNGRIDVLVASKAEANAFGRKQAKVKIISKGER